jgi:hypothetical protein
MDNSNTRKEGVSRTYQKVDGYTPIAAYLGNEGWCLGMELRPGRHPAKRRRLGTVLQERVDRAAVVIHTARQIILNVGHDIGRMTVLETLRSRLRYPRGSPC